VFAKNWKTGLAFRVIGDAFILLTKLQLNKSGIMGFVDERF
jgi:hypothetical protein